MESSLPLCRRLRLPGEPTVATSGAGDVCAALGCSQRKVTTTGQSDTASQTAGTRVDCWHFIAGGVEVAEQYQSIRSALTESSCALPIRHAFFSRSGSELR